MYFTYPLSFLGEKRYNKKILGLGVLLGEPWTGFEKKGYKERYS